MIIQNPNPRKYHAPRAHNEPLTNVKLKYISLNDRLYRYVCACRSDAGDPILEALRVTTESLGDISRMQISREQGSFMSLLVAAIGAKSAVEVGTFTGYSSLCIARGLAPRGRLICIDQSEEWTAIARKYWGRRQNRVRCLLRTDPAAHSAERADSPRQHALGRTPRSGPHPTTEWTGHRKTEPQTGA